MAFSWSRASPLEVTRRIDPSRKVYLVSDLHLGDGTRSDAFLGKDRELIRFLDRVRDEDAHLVVAGDAIDFQQAWAMNRVLKAHARLIGELSRLADTNGITYIWGNHDYDISLFRDLLRFDVCSSLYIGDKVLVQHGYEYDPFIGPNLDQTHLATVVHHLTERLLDSWIRLPLENFYTLPNRVAFWLTHKMAWCWNRVHALSKRAGLEPSPVQGLVDSMHYWTQNELGDPGCLVAGVRDKLLDSDLEWLVCGHSHLPGLVEIAPGKTYVNTGSWTFNSAQYAVWDGERFTVRDWIRDKTYGDAAYRPILSGRFKHMGYEDWWRENYLGWLRFRVGEEGRLPALRGGRSGPPPREPADPSVG
jgi:UDP-2,3-diacylglucosamine pyrophosphatase LpxH